MHGNSDGNWFGRLVWGGGITYGIWRALKPETREQISEGVSRALEAWARVEEARRKHFEELARQTVLREAAQEINSGFALEIQEPNPIQLIPKPGELLGESASTGLPITDGRLRELLERVNVLLLIGGKGSGKSALAYLIAESNLGSQPVFAVGVPESASSLLPDGLGIVQSIDELPNGCTAVIDEAYLSHHARNSAAEANRNLAAIVNLSRQRDQLLIFVTQEARQLDRGVIAAADMFAIREPSPFQAQIDRPELRHLISQAADAIGSAEGDAQDWAFIHAPKSGFTGLIRTRLPSFWTSEISTMYGGTLPSARSRSPSELTWDEKIEKVRRMRLVEGKSFRDIARHFRVSPSTIYNWLNDYPYRSR